MRRYNFIKVSGLAERTERRQQAILTRELRSEWERLGRINCKYFHRNLSSFKELKLRKSNVDLAGDLAWEGIWPGNYITYELAEGNPLLLSAYGGV